MRALVPRQAPQPVHARAGVQRTSKSRSEVVTWLEGGEKATEAVRERRSARADLRRARRDTGARASRTARSPSAAVAAATRRHTWRRYGHSLDYTLLPARSNEFPLGEGFGDRVAAHIEDGRLADVRRPLRAPRAEALDDQQPPGGGQRDLQLGRLPDPAPGRPQPGARGRAAARRRDQAAAHRRPRRGRAPARRARRRRRAALRDRLLRRPAPLRARPPGVVRRRPRGAADPRAGIQERGGRPTAARRSPHRWCRSCSTPSCARADPSSGRVLGRRA